MMLIWFFCLEDQYVGNSNSNVTHISSVAMHVDIMYIHTFYPWLCQMLLHICDAHAASHIFNRSQIGNYTFRQKFGFVDFNINL